MNVRKGRPVLVKLIILCTALLGVTFLVFRFSPRDVADRANRFFNASSKALAYDTVATNAENIALKHLASGFWDRVDPRQLPEKPFALNDRLELKENGIFWQVRLLTLWLPSGDSTRCMQVITGYLNPFKRISGDSTAFVVDALVRSQVFAWATDTCYQANVQKTIEGQADIMAMTPEVYASTLKRGDSTLVMDGMSYTAYDTAQQKLADFFPRGSVELVNNLGVQECRSGTSFATFVCSELQRYFASVPARTVTPADVVALIREFYQPLVLSELARKYTTEVLKPLKGTLSISMQIGSDGAVLTASKIKGRVANEYFEQELLKVIQSWRFMRSENASQSLKVDYDFVF